MRYFNHLVAVLLFLPITISFIICMLFEIVWNIATGLHPASMKQIDPNTFETDHLYIHIPKERYIVTFIFRLFVVIASAFIQFFIRMKEIFQYDFMTKETPEL